MNFQEMTDQLNLLGSKAERKFAAKMLKDDATGETAINITLEEFEEFPIIVVAFEDSLICYAILFSQEDVEADLWTELLEELLGLNIVIPQCSFALQDDMVTLVRNMPIDVSASDVSTAANVLVAVAYDVIQELTGYLANYEEEEGK